MDTSKKSINTEKATSVFFDHCEEFLAGIDVRFGNGYKKLCTFVVISEVDADASKKPITVKNVTKKATSVFFIVMGFLLASMSASETATEHCSTLRALMY